MTFLGALMTSNNVADDQTRSPNGGLMGSNDDSIKLELREQAIERAGERAMKKEVVKSRALKSIAGQILGNALWLHQSTLFA